MRKQSDPSGETGGGSGTATIEFYPRTPTDAAYLHEIVMIKADVPRQEQSGAEISQKERNTLILRYCITDDEASLWKTANEDKEKTYDIGVGEFGCKLYISQAAKHAGCWSFIAGTLNDTLWGDAVDKVRQYVFEFEEGELSTIHIEHESEDGSIYSVEYVRAYPEAQVEKKKREYVPAALVRKLDLDCVESRLHRIGGNSCSKQVFEGFL